MFQASSTALQKSVATRTSTNWWDFRKVKKFSRNDTMAKSHCGFTGLQRQVADIFLMWSMTWLPNVRYKYETIAKCFHTLIDSSVNNKSFTVDMDLWCQPCKHDESDPAVV